MPAAADPHSPGPLPQAADLGVWWAFTPRTHQRLNLCRSGVCIERLEQLRLERADLLTSLEPKTYGAPIEHLGDLNHDPEVGQAC